MGTASLDAAALSDGTGTSLLTTTAATGTAHVVTITPQGTLGGLGVKTLTVTTDSTAINAAPDADIAFSVTSPSDAATATGTVDAGNRAQSVRTGSSAITVGITGAAASVNLRFKVTASAGTVDGVAFGTPQYKVVATSATGTGNLSFTLGGGALLNTANVTVEQVDVLNASINPPGAGTTADIVISQADAAVAAGTLIADIQGSIVRTLGTVTPVSITVKDQFGGLLGSGWTIRAYRGSKSAANLISTATTNASGVATVSVSGAAAITSGTSETYVYSADYPGVTQVDATTTLTVAYTTTGGITSLSVAIAGDDGALATALTAADATITDTESTVTARFPVVYVPSSGTVTEGAGQTAYASLAGSVTAGGGLSSNTFRLAADADANNTSTYTTTEGAFVAAAAGGAWNAGLSTLTVAEGVSVYVFATKTGLHTVTVTSGGKTVAIRFWAVNKATDYYTISAVADNASLQPSANTIVTATVRDIFGNVVDAADGLLTATAADKVRLAGQALSQSLNTTAAGTSAFTIIGDASAGTGTITIAPTSTGANAWDSTYVAPTGAGVPVKSATVTITIVGGPAKSAELVAIEAVQATLATMIAQAIADATAAAAAATAATTAAAAQDLKIAALQAALDAAAIKAEAQDAAIKAAADAAAKAATDAAAAATANQTATATAIAAAQAAAVAAADIAAETAAEAVDAARDAEAAAKAAEEAADLATAAAEQAGEDAVTAATAATDAALEAIDAGMNAYDAATGATEAAELAESAAIQAGEDAVAAIAEAADAAAQAADLAAEATEEAIDAATAAGDAASAAGEAADAAIAAAQDAADAANAATAAAQEASDAVAALSTQVTAMMSDMKKQITALTNLVIRIQKKVKA
jgi:hypothetical protein